MSKDRYNIYLVIVTYECITSRPSWQKTTEELVAFCWAKHAPLSYLCRVYFDIRFKLQEKLLCIRRKFAASVVYHTALVITERIVRCAAYPKFCRWGMGNKAFGHILSIRISQWIYFSKWTETGWRLQLLGKAWVNLMVISLKRICKLSDYNTGQEQVSVRLLYF